MGKWIRKSLLTIVLLHMLVFPVAANTIELIPVGKTIGLDLECDGVYLIRFDGQNSPAQNAGLKVGDKIVSVNGNDLQNAEELHSEILKSSGDQIILNVERCNKPMSFTVSPDSGKDGWQIGVYVQDRITGLGTVTFYDPGTGVFGALGHGVNQASTGLPITLARGMAVDARVSGIQKGAPGTPGSLKGSPKGRMLGVVLCNTPQGIFGYAEGTAWSGAAVPVASHEQITTGPAEILSTVNGTATKRYSVDIEELSFNSETGRNLLLKVTDPELLDETGGIVQGMSGSPIIQNGRLIGAVTHVLIQDPTRGYGIFIENMLNGYQAEQITKAA